MTVPRPLSSRLPGTGGTGQRHPVTRLLGCVIPLAGFTAALVTLTLCLLEVTSAGGFCARGGPYVIAHECSGHSALLIPASIWAMLIFLALSLLSGGFGARLVLLFWSALFCTLGGAFMYSARLPNYSAAVGYGVGGMFVVMGAPPLLVLLRKMPLTLLAGNRTITGEPIERRPKLGHFVAGFVPSAVGVGGGWWAGLALLAAF